MRRKKKQKGEEEKKQKGEEEKKQKGEEEKNIRLRRKKTEEVVDRKKQKRWSREKTKKTEEVIGGKTKKQTEEVVGGKTRKQTQSFFVFLHGLMTWKVMQRNVWNDILSWQARRHNNSTKYLLHASMITTLKRKKRNLLEKCQIHALKLF